MSKLPWLIAAAALVTAGAVVAQPAQDSVARAFTYEKGVVDLLVIGPAAKDIYDRLPGRGEVQACGASGLHKVRDGVTCAKDGADYSCHIWLDASKPALTLAEADDC